MNNIQRRIMFESGGLYHIFMDQGFSGFMRPHSHSFHQLTVIDHGRITQMSEGENKNQLYGDLFFSPAHSEHSLFVFGGDTVYYTLSFAEPVLREALRAVPCPPERLKEKSLFFHMPEEDYRRFLALMSLLMSWPEQQTPGAPDQGCHLCTAAVILFLKAAMQSFEEETAEEKSLPDETEKNIQAVLRYIDSHYPEALKMEDLLARSGLSKSSFYTHFSRLTGITPRQYITEKRMHEALRLIRDTELPFGQIAEEVGYEDFSTFFRNFFRMTGQSPSDYRLQQKKAPRES